MLLVAAMYRSFTGEYYVYFQLDGPPLLMSSCSESDLRLNIGRIADKQGATVQWVERDDFSFVYIH